MLGGELETEISVQTGASTWVIDGQVQPMDNSSANDQVPYEVQASTGPMKSQLVHGNYSYVWFS